MEQTAHDYSGALYVASEAVRDGLAALPTAETTDLDQLLAHGHVEYAPRHRPSLHDAVRGMPPPAALALFETADLTQLEERAALFEWLRHPPLPLASLDELRHLTADYVAHLDRNRQLLIETGHPATSFERSPWHFDTLGKTYPTKTPDEVHKSRLEPMPGMATYHLDGRELGVDFVYAYEWSRATSTGGRALAEYANADRDPAIPRDVAARLESLRPILFDLKRAVLELLVEALRERWSSDRLCDRAFALVITAILAPDAEFLLEVDRQILGNDIRSGQRNYDTAAVTGGLSDLFEVIGHYAEELDVGLMRQLREGVEALLIEDELGRTRPRAMSVWALYATDQADALEPAAEVLDSVGPAAIDRWDAYVQRVHRALQDDFEEEVVTKTRERRSVAHKLEDLVQRYAEHARASLAARPR